MDVEYRAIADDEFAAFFEADRAAFSSEAPTPEMPLDFARAELARTCAAFIGDEIVGTGRNYSLELTLPGGSVVPAAGVSWIAVKPTHRRRGVLTGVIASLHDDAAARGEALSILTASEGGIYARFGYGIATWRMLFEVERAHGRFAYPVAEGGHLVIVDRAEAIRRFPAVYERACRARPGMVSRPPTWWDETYHFLLPPEKASFFVVHVDESGRDDGYAAYHVSGDFSTGISEKVLVAPEVVATSIEARHALYTYLFGVDLVHTLRFPQAAVDDPLRFLLADPRRLRTLAVNDQLWVRILDVERALEARRYATTDRITLEVHDGPTVTRVALEGSPEGAHCTAADAEPDVVLGVAQLGSIYLGGVRAEQHAAAGLVEERSPGAVARLDAMFASYPPPASPTWF